MGNDLTRSLEHGGQALGAALVREGFAFSPKDDLAFALGWPHLITLGDDQEEPGAAARALISAYPEPSERSWPRLAAQRVARALAAGPTRTGGLSPEAEEGLANEEALGEDEARELLRQYLGLRAHQWMLSTLATHLFEALLGPSATLEIFVSTVEERYDDWMERHVARCVLLNQLGFHLLRVPSSEAKALRGRLEALFSRYAEGADLSKRDVTRGIRELDLVLHGRAGVERSAYRVDDAITPGSLLHLTDDEDFVYQEARRCPQDVSSMVEARLAFLAGERWLDEEALRWSRYKRPRPGPAHARVVAHLGRIRSERLLPIMLAMTARSKAKAAAVRWFVDHADYAGAWVEQTAAGGGDEATWAAKVLKKMKPKR